MPARGSRSIGVRSTAVPTPSASTVVPTPSAAKRGEGLGYRTREDEQMNRWLQLVGTVLGSVCCVGLIPGQAAFTQMFMDAGVGASKCPNSGGLDSSDTKSSDSSGAAPGFCAEQNVAVSIGFTIGMSISVGATLPIGYVFDKYGGRISGLCGGSICAIGLLLLQIPLLGAAFGLDSWTINLLPFAIIITDFGSMMTMFSAFSLMWHFHDVQTLLIAIAQSTYSSGSMAPVVLQYVMEKADIGFSAVIGMYALASMVGCTAFYSCTPSQEQYRVAAKDALGIPLPKPKKNSSKNVLAHAHNILMADWFEHAIAIGCCGCFYSVLQLYNTLLPSFAKVVLADPVDADALPAMASKMMAVVGVTVSPLITVIAEKAIQPVPALLMCLVISAIACFVTVPATSWGGQVVCCFSNAVFSGLFNVIMVKRIAVYVLPTAFGAVNGLLSLYLLFILTPCMTVDYVVLGDMQNLPERMQGLFAVGVAAIVAFALRLQYTGLPAQPVMLDVDKKELASMFNCESLDQVAELTNRTIPEVLKAMASHSPKDLATLLQSIDYSRMESMVDDHAAVAVDTADETDAADATDLESEDSLPLPGKPPSSKLKVTPGGFFTGQLLQHLGCGTTANDGSVVVTGCCHTACCHDEDLTVEGNSLQTPLLEQQSAISDKLIREQEMKRRKARAREIRRINERLWTAVFAKQSEEVLRIYAEEDTTKLYEAFVDLYEWKSKAEVDAMEKASEDMDLDTQFEALMEERPALKVMFLKMMALRMQKRWLA